MSHARPRSLEAPLSRREALLAAAPLAAALAAAWSLPRPARADEIAHAHGRPRPHPDPRAGVTAARVLAPAQIGRRRRDALAAYDAARAIPEVLDGLSCYCDCETGMGHRSLLSCFESRQGATCISCQEQALFAFAQHRAGRTLAEIRRAVDAEFG